MNWLKVCEIGFKVVTAIVAGTAVFIGVEQAMSGVNNRRKKSGQFGPESNTSSSGMFGPDPSISNQPQNEAEVEPKLSSGQKVLNGLKGATSTCSKLLTFAQSLTTVAENFSRIFQGGSDNYGYGWYNGQIPPPGYPYGYYNYGYQEMGGTTWRRLSPCVIEALPNNNSNMYGQSQRYPF